MVAHASCTVHEVQTGPPLDKRARWVLLPVQNHSETPQAGERAEAIVGTFFRARGVQLIAAPPAQAQEGLPDFDEHRRYDNALTWAKSEGFQLALTGSVEEWRYRSGLDGDPAVGLTLQVLELPLGRVLWSASGARAGWGRDTLSATAQAVIRDLFRSLNL